MKTELAQFIELKAELDTLVAPTLTIEVRDFETSASAIEAAKAVKALKKRVEDKRVELVKPLNDQVKKVNEYAKEIALPLDRAETHLKGQLTAFEIKQEAIRRAEYEKAEKERREREAALAKKQEEGRLALEEAEVDEAEVADVFGADDAGPSAAEKAAELERKHSEERALIAQQAKDREYDIKSRGVANARKTWQCEVEDIALVPKEFLIVTLNEKAVLAAARAGVAKIAGVRLWQEVSIAIGANTSVARALR